MENNQSKVIVRSIKNKDLEVVVLNLFEKLDWKSIVRPNAKVVIKLNLCEFDATKVRNSNTSPELVVAVCNVLKQQTKDITLVEAHSYRAPAEIAFENTGIYKIAKDLGVKTVNLSKSKLSDKAHALLGPLPEILLNADVFMTMPKLKTHALTYFTGALKNQWGCVPRHDRIALHHSLDRGIADLQKILNPQLIIMDGIVGMEGRGPTNGEPRELDILLASNDAIAIDATAMRLVGLDPHKASHVVLAYKDGLGSIDESDIEVDMDFERNWDDFKPAKLDWAVRAMNYMTRFGWFREYILSVNWIFYPTKKVVNFLRKIGIVR